MNTIERGPSPVLGWNPPNNIIPDCIENYTISVDGVDITTADNSTTIMFAELNLQLCENKSITVTPNVVAVSDLSMSTSAAFRPLDGKQGTNLI